METQEGRRERGKKMRKKRMRNANEIIIPKIEAIYLTKWEVVHPKLEFYAKNLGRESKLCQLC